MNGVVRPRPGVGARAAAAALCLAAAAATRAQTPIFRTGIDAVEVDVAVTRGGRPVVGLTAANFALRDNDIPQDVHAAPLADLPLRVVLTLDTSYSVRGGRLRRLIEAGQTLVAALKPGDQISLITFSHDVRVRVPMSPPGAAIGDALMALTAGGPTALRDALQLALASQVDQRSRSLVVLFSDGDDTASWMPYEEVLEFAERSSSVVHAVRFEMPENLSPFVDRVAKATNGKTWVAESDSELKDLFTRSLNEMRSRYLLTYTYAGERRPGWHQIKVSLKDARGDVAARPGYFVGAPAKP